MADQGRRFRFTAARIKRLAAPAEGYAYHWDLGFPGFGVRVSSKGAKAWTMVARIDGKAAQFGVGRYPAVTLAEARRRAGDKLKLIDRGVDPRLEERERLEKAERDRLNSFRAVAEEYIDRCVKKGEGRPGRKRGQPFRSGAEVERVLRRYVMPRWGKKSISAITAEDVARLLDSVLKANGPAQSNKVLITVRAVFYWASDFLGVLDTVPVRPRMKRSVDTERDRILTPAEIKILWPALEWLGYPFGYAYCWLLITGQRLGEASHMQQGEVDLAAAIWTIPAARHKSGRDHAVPLGTFALAFYRQIPRMAGSDFVFAGRYGGGITGFSGAHARILERLKEVDTARVLTAHWTRHDLRRTVASEMQDLQIEPHVIDAVQGRGHGAITRVYLRGEMIDAKRAALETWGDRLKFLVFNSKHYSSVG